LLCVLLLAPALPASAQGAASCTDFDAWTWAQSVYDADRAANAALDPDGDGIACPELPIAGAFGPVSWASAIPAGAEAAQVVGITDGDTFTVSINGVEDTIRMYHIDTPETSNLAGGPHCGGDEATAFLQTVLAYAPGGTVYLEYDQTQRDRFDRRLAYVWYQLGDDVYLVNEVMVRNGWAESETFEPDVKYREQLNAAEQFSVDHVLGVRLLCGRFGQPPGAQPSPEQLRQAMQRQPNQGQFTAPQPTSVPQPAPQLPVPAPEPTQAPVQPPAQQGPAPEVPSGECDPSYPDFCLAPAWVIGDLDCGDIGYRRFTVLPPDSHNFDGDFDGVGCER